MKGILYCVSFILILSSACAQSDSVILFNGKSYIGEIVKVENGTLYITDKNNGSVDITLDRIFSYTDDGKETICYAQSEFTGDFLTVDETRFATIGAYDARQTVKPRFAFYSSLALGLGISLLDTYYTQNAYDNFVTENGYPPSKAHVGFFGAPPTLMPIFVPLILSASWAIPNLRIRPKQLLHDNMYGNENYYRGFNRVAKQKRILASLKGSAIGIGTGLLSYIIVSQF